MPRFGAHMSVAGGLDQALFRGNSIGCDTIQLFLRSPTRWEAAPIEPEDVLAFQAARRATDITPIVAHGSYLINLASAKKALWRRSLSTLIDDLGRCQRLGLDAYVLHPGAHTGSGEEAGLLRVTEAIRRALQAFDGDVQLLLENTAGQGTSLGYRLEHLGKIIEGAGWPERLGICIDTAHAVAAGYTLAGAEAYASFWETVDRLVGIERVGCLHLNDSLGDQGSRVDRHAHIGEGHVGVDGFRRLVNDPALQKVPMILETPKGEDMLEDIRNLALLRSLCDQGEEPHLQGAKRREGIRE
ncbi:MAG: deoxyribonuclease IV [Anaerolineae bacterium]